MRKTKEKSAQSKMINLILIYLPKSYFCIVHKCFILRTLKVSWVFEYNFNSKW